MYGGWERPWLGICSVSFGQTSLRLAKLARKPRNKNKNLTTPITWYSTNTPLEQTNNSLLNDVTFITRSDIYVLTILCIWVRNGPSVVRLTRCIAWWRRCQCITCCAVERLPQVINFHLCMETQEAVATQADVACCALEDICFCSFFYCPMAHPTLRLITWFSGHVQALSCW